MHQLRTKHLEPALQSFGVMIELAVGLRRFSGLVADVYVHGDLHTSTPTRIADALAAEDEVPPEACWVLPSTLLEEGFFEISPSAAVCKPLTAIEPADFSRSAVNFTPAH